MSNDCYNPMLPQDKAYFQRMLFDLHKRVAQLELLREPHLKADNYVTGVTVSGNELTFSFLKTAPVTISFMPADSPELIAALAAAHTHANKQILDATTSEFTVLKSAQLAQLAEDVAGILAHPALA